MKAQDNGDPIRSSEVLVHFNIKDTNDNAPLFEPASYDSAVYENVTVGTSLLQVFATDVDSGKFPSSTTVKLVLLKKSLCTSTMIRFYSNMKTS